MAPSNLLTYKPPDGQGLIGAQDLYVFFQAGEQVRKTYSFLVGRGSTDTPK